MTMVMIPIQIIRTKSLTELSQQTAENATDPACLPQLAQYHSRRFLGFALREVISVRRGFLSQTLELRMGGADTPAALHCLWDTSQGIRGGMQMKKRPAFSLPDFTSPPLRRGRRGEIIMGESGAFFPSHTGLKFAVLLFIKP